MEEYKLDKRIIIKLVKPIDENIKSPDDLFEIYMKCTETSLDYVLYLSRELLYYIFRDSILQIISLSVPVTYELETIKIEQDEKELFDRISNIILPGCKINLDVENNEVLVNGFIKIKPKPEINSIDLHLSNNCKIISNSFQVTNKYKLFDEFMVVSIKDIINLTENLRKNS